MKTRIESIMQAEERRAEKVQEFNALLQDPDISDYVAKLFGEPVSSLPKPAPTASNGNGHNGQKLANLTLTPAIRFVYDSIPQKFFISDVVKLMQAEGYDFGKRDPATAVRDAIYLLCKGEKPMFRITVKGQGGKPNQYEKI